MRLADALAGVDTLALDTTPIIYFVEEHPQYRDLLANLFGRIDRGDITGVTSVVTGAEVLVHPIKNGNVALAEAYSTLLETSENMCVVPIDLGVAQRAAGIRARNGIRTPDAFQIAAAIEAGCDAFLTNDSKLARVTEIRVIVLNSLSLG
jgi:predicted nucleic acid-binding protein